jgi:hypothetical protein
MLVNRNVAPVGGGSEGMGMKHIALVVGGLLAGMYLGRRSRR